AIDLVHVGVRLEFDKTGEPTEANSASGATSPSTSTYPDFVRNPVLNERIGLKSGIELGIVCRLPDADRLIVSNERSGAPPIPQPETACRSECSKKVSSIAESFSLFLECGINGSLPESGYFLLPHHPLAEVERKVNS